jgi:hypothetical protein
MKLKFMENNKNKDESIKRHRLTDISRNHSHKNHLKSLCLKSRLLARVFVGQQLLAQLELKLFCFKISLKYRVYYAVIGTQHILGFLG